MRQLRRIAKEWPRPDTHLTYMINIALAVAGVIYGSWMIALDSAPQDAVPALARWLLGLGVVATLAANVAHRLGHDLIGSMNSSSS